MNKQKDIFLTAEELRERAEKALKSKAETIADIAIDESKLLHELQVHQIELEMQNEALVAARDAAEHALERYTKLFDFAPIAYFVVSQNGLIQQTNVRGEDLLGIQRSRMTGQPFIKSVSVNFRQDFDRFLEQVFKSTDAQSCDLSLQSSGMLKWVRIEAIADGDRQACVMTVTDITKEHNVNDVLIQSYDDLIQSYKEFRLLAEVMPQIVWITGADGKHIFCNRQWLDYTGLTQEQSQGDGWIVPFHPDDRERAWDVWRNTVTTGGGYSLECRLRRADGAYRWWLVRGLPVFEDNGKIMKWFGTCTDIHQLKLTEQSLFESEARWQFALEGSHQGVWDWDFPTGKIFYSSQWKSMLGFADDEVSDQVEEWSERVHPDDQQAAMDDLQKHWRGETAFYQNEHRMRNRNNGYLWILDRGMVISRDAAGLPLRMIGTSQDISARHQLLEQIKDSESLTRSIMDSLGSYIAVLNERGDIIRTNQTWRNFAAENGGECLIQDSTSQNYFEILHKLDHLPDVSGILAGMLAVSEGRQKSFSIEYFRDSAWFRLEARPLDGSVRGLVTHHIDITECKNLEKAFRHSEARYRTLFENSLEAIFVNRGGNQIEEVNDACLKLWGANQPEELLDKHPLELFHADYHSMINERLTLAMASRVAQPFIEKQIIRLDGTIADVQVSNIPAKWKSIYRQALTGAYLKNDDDLWIQADGNKYWLRWTVSPWTDEYGKIGGIIISFENITERKQAEDKLRRSEGQLRFITDHIPIYVAQCDYEKCYKFVNRPYAELFGLQPSDIIGKHVLEILGEKAYVKSQYYMDVVLSGLETRYDMTLPATALGALAVSVHYLPERNEDGRVVGFIAAISDITARKQAEESLRESKVKYQELSNHLELVREEERTRIAREIHDDLGSFLTVLKMDLSWLDKQLPANLRKCREKTRLMTQQVDEGIQTVKRIINDLRPSILDHLGLFAAIEWKVEDFRRRTHIHCLLTLPELNLSLDADRSTAIFRILQEALTNILSHAKAGKVSIAIELSENNLTMTIADNGCGIASAQNIKSTGFGIQGMQERARHFGGLLNIAS